jgi:hypothetical protein
MQITTYKNLIRFNLIFILLKFIKRKKKIKSWLFKPTILSSLHLYLNTVIIYIDFFVYLTSFIIPSRFYYFYVPFLKKFY